MVTKTNEIPFTDLGPNDVLRIRKTMEAVSGTAIAVLFLEMLKKHSDPSVVFAATQLEELVQPLISQSLEKHSIEPTKPDRYELKLSSVSNTYSIGSSSYDTLQIEGLASEHLRVLRFRETWQVYLLGAGTLLVGDQRVHRVDSRGGTDSRYSLEVKPGDTLQLGMIHITLLDAEE
jgi:hypothetical protein